MSHRTLKSSKFQEYCRKLVALGIYHFLTGGGRLFVRGARIFWGGRSGYDNGQIWIWTETHPFALFLIDSYTAGKFKTFPCKNRTSFFNIPKSVWIQPFKSVTIKLGMITVSWFVTHLQDTLFHSLHKDICCGTNNPVRIISEKAGNRWDLFE